MLKSRMNPLTDRSPLEGEPVKQGRSPTLNWWGVRWSGIPVPLLCCLLLVRCGPAGDGASYEWRDYDERDHLALVEEHESSQMHFRLLNTQGRDKNDMWRPFAGDLDGFGGRYKELAARLLGADITAMQRMVAEGDLSYEELTKFYLYRIRAVETDHARYLNAVISLNPDAIAEAAARDAGIAGSPLYGIPILLKDNIGAAGLPTTAGALALADNHTDDAFITWRLRQAGAVILGKANLSEWAYFFCGDCPSGYSAIGGQTMNPYGRFRFTPGGSSSGSGAAVAAGYAAAAVGTETSGSILSPSSANSLVGLKPTTGSLSRSGIVPISATLDTPGPMARSVADAVLLFNAMAGYDETDTAMPRLSEGMRLEYRESLQGKRLGAPLAYLEDPLFSAAVEQLREGGAVIVEVEIPDTDRDDFESLLGGEMVRDLAAYLSDWAAEEVAVTSVADVQQFNEAAPETRAPYGQALIDMMAGLQLSPQELQAIADPMQQEARAALGDLFTDHDLDALLSINNYNAGLAALANYPALTIPMGYTEEGRPMNLTFIAPSFQEQVLVNIGGTYEALSQARQAPDGYQ